MTPDWLSLGGDRLQIPFIHTCGKTEKVLKALLAPWLRLMSCQQSRDLLGPILLPAPSRVVLFPMGGNLVVANALDAEI